MEGSGPKTVKVRRVGVNPVQQSADKPQMQSTKMINENLGIRYTETVQIDTHLYKLVESPVIKYLGKEMEQNAHPDVTPQDFIEMGHAHIFRTTDSDGKKHVRSVPIAGHYHLLELSFEDGEDKAPKVVAMSGPMKLVQKLVHGRKVMVDEPVNHFDHHIHDVQYLKSEKIQARSTNIEATKFMAAEGAKAPGAVGGVAEAGRR